MAKFPIFMHDSADLSEGILGSLKDTWTIGVRWPFKSSQGTRYKVGNMYFCSTNKMYVYGGERKKKNCL